MNTVYMICGTIMCIVLVAYFKFPKIRFNVASLIAYIKLKNRMLVMDLKSTIMDAAFCLSVTDNKLIKRIKRLELLLFSCQNIKQVLGNDYNYVYEIYHASLVKRDNNAIRQADNINEESIRDLFTKKEVGFFIANGLFDEQSTSLKPYFDGIAKDIVNETGEVYDIMSKVVMIAFSRFVSVRRAKDSIAFYLVKDCDLVFKGGASIGKYLLRDLTKTRAKDIFEVFVSKGDNDTSIKFKPLDMFSDYDVYVTQKTLMDEFIQHIGFVVEDFRVEELLARWIEPVLGHRVDVVGKSFVYESGNSRNFCIDPYIQIDGKELNRIRFTSLSAKSLYFTTNVLDFSVRGIRSNFYLGRMKYAFTLRGLEPGEKITVNSELLDVSIMTPFATDRHLSFVPIRYFD